MRSPSIRASILGAVLCFAPAIAPAQVWDGATRAASWAKQDKDDSFTFYDAQERALHTWARDGGLLRTIPLAKLDAQPERWVVDPRGSAWVAHGTTLTLIDKGGRIVTSARLPAEVGDLCWDTRGFVISYRTAEPYLEMRDFKTAAVLWSFGAKPPKGDGPAPVNRRPVLTDDAGNVILADGPSLSLSLLDGVSGRKLSEAALAFNGGRAPALEGAVADRGPLALWPGRGVVFAALKASQVPAAHRGTLQGTVLARIDLVNSALAFLPTGLDESHALVGVLDSDAVFVNPRGGLMLVQIK